MWSSKLIFPGFPPCFDIASALLAVTAAELVAGTPLPLCEACFGCPHPLAANLSVPSRSDNPPDCGRGSPSIAAHGNHSTAPQAGISYECSSMPSRTEK
jgi:hypothetical protein